MIVNISDQIKMYPTFRKTYIVLFHLKCLKKVSSYYYRFYRDLFVGHCGLHLVDDQT